VFSYAEGLPPEVSGRTQRRDLLRMAYNGLGDREIFVEQADQSYLSKEWAQRRGSSKVLKFWSSGVLECYYLKTSG
jgi:hypothetical protein